MAQPVAPSYLCFVDRMTIVDSAISKRPLQRGGTTFLLQTPAVAGGRHRATPGSTMNVPNVKCTSQSGACGKARVVTQNRQPRPDREEVGGVRQ